ncbi:MAG: multicopper oxidase family protein [Alphaproteobacteria bacterium]|nr:multicopper oxidase family protein [Alphaproteobacteria bacterium]
MVAPTPHLRSPIGRRRFLAGALAAAVLPAVAPPARAEGAGVRVALVARERPRLLPGCAAPSLLWTYGEDWPLALRVARGAPFAATLRNELADHTTVHWHGVRVPFAMDGVPWVTQPPVLPGESFTYRFAPPDPGTFFFHPHCNTMEALGRGLAGVLVVEDPRDAGRFDVDRVVALKDWRVRADGAFDAFSTDTGAARAGTFGDLRTANGRRVPEIAVAPGDRVRLRIVNLDPTRAPLLDFGPVPAMVIATDGNACTPFRATGWRLGPAMRADVAFVAPPRGTVTLADGWAAAPVPLARIVVAGAPAAASRAPLALPPAELPVPDLRRAETLEMALLAGSSDPDIEKWARETGMSADALCLSRRIFWSINRRAWPGQGHERLPPPLAELKRGRSYVLELFNGTPHIHPMHLHGHTFRVLGTAGRTVPPHWADTVLVEPKERMRIAFVAGEPGDWMFHCHIIEHQESGMMGYLRVS